jgi:hypothetical protein
MSSNNHDDSWKDSRLTCEYVPPDDYDERYDYDSLLLTTENAAFLTDDECDFVPSAPPFDPEHHLRVASPPRSRSYCDDPSWESITCANCQQFESANYSYTHDFDTYCCDCALKLFNKVVWKPARMCKPLDIEVTLDECQHCENYTTNQFNDIPCCYNCVYIETLLQNYTVEERTELVLYANDYNLTIEQAIEYQTQCHACSKEISSTQFDHDNHRYCSKWCFDSSEEYYISCFRKGDCLVCDTWRIHEFRENPDKYQMIPVLTAIEALKELSIYNQLNDTLIDLVEYFV